MYMCIIFVKERDPLLTAVNVVLEEKLDEFNLTYKTKERVC